MWIPSHICQTVMFVILWSIMCTYLCANVRDRFRLCVCVCVCGNVCLLRRRSIIIFFFWQCWCISLFHYFFIMDCAKWVCSLLLPGSQLCKGIPYQPFPTGCHIFLARSMMFTQQRIGEGFYGTPGIADLWRTFLHYMGIFVIRC